MRDLSFANTVEFEILNWLDLSYNDIKSIDKETMFRLNNLNYFSLQGCKLNALADDVTSSNLTELNLEDNQITDVFIQSIPTRFPHLTHLNLKGNPLTGPTKANLTTNVGIKVFFDVILARAESFDELYDDDREYLSNSLDEEFDKVSIDSTSSKNDIDESSFTLSDCFTSHSSDGFEKLSLGKMSTEEKMCDKEKIQKDEISRPINRKGLTLYISDSSFTSEDEAAIIMPKPMQENEDKIEANNCDLEKSNSILSKVEILPLVVKEKNNWNKLVNSCCHKWNLMFLIAVLATNVFYFFNSN